MKKKSLALIIAIIFAFGSGVIAKDVFEVVKAQLRTDFAIVIDGQEREFENAQGERVYPLLHDGTTYLPIRAIGEIMEKTVYWYEEDKRVELRAKPSSTVTDADVIILEEKKKENKKEDKAGFISPEEAKKIALEKSEFNDKDVHFKKAELDNDDGIWFYEIEFKTGGVEHEFEIGAVNGVILSWEIDKEKKRDDEKKHPADLISKEKAKEIALNKAELSKDEVIFEEVELDEDDGVFKYEIEFKKGDTEYEAEINAKNGEIIKWEIDIDD